MKEKRAFIKAFLWTTIGGLVVAILLPVLSVAVQTYVLPNGATTGDRTELLTNLPNRTEALRSSFSGASAPTSPTPVAGQLWMDTTNDILSVRNAAGSAWVKLLRSGSVVSADITDGTIVSADISDGTVASADIADGTIVNADISSSAAITMNKLAAASSCSAGFTEIRGWCMDTDGDLTLIRSATANEGSYTTSTVNASAKVALIKTMAIINQDGTGEAAEVDNCVIPGDSGVTGCASLGLIHAAATARLANEYAADGTTVAVRTDSSGQIKTRCVVSGVLLAAQCNWYIAGYLP